MLLVIERHGDNQTVEKKACPLNDVQVTVRYRIETSGIDRQAGRGVHFSASAE